MSGIVYQKENKKIRVLIVDDNKDFRELMETYINKTSDFEVVGTAEDGIEAIEKIVDLTPDVVTLDLIMPNLDGFGVLEKLQDINFVKKPMIVVLSALGQDNLIRKSLSFGIEYYFVKPLDIGNLVNRIRQMIDSNENGYADAYYNSQYNETIGNMSPEKREEYIDNNIEIEVTTLLHEAGVSPHMVGHRYLKEAIIYTIKSSKPFRSITRELYPAIAEKFSTTPQKVERAIRNCIEKGWLRTSHDTIDSLLGYTKNNSKSKPTNSEFIAMMSEKVRITQKNTKKP